MGETNMPTLTTIETDVKFPLSCSSLLTAKVKKEIIKQLSVCWQQ